MVNWAWLQGEYEENAFIDSDFTPRKYIELILYRKQTNRPLCDAIKVRYLVAVYMCTLELYLINFAM